MKEFIWAVVVSVLLVSALGGWEYYQLQQMRQETTSALQDLRVKNAENAAALTELNDALKDTAKSTSDNFDKVENSLSKLGQDITLVQQEGLKRANELTGQLQLVKQENDEKFSELEQQINVNLKSTDFSAIVDDVLKSVVAIRTDKGVGSGAIIDTQGYIITNYHVIDGVTAANVRTVDGTVHAVGVVGTDVVNDIAVLKIEGTFKRLRFADSDSVSVGQRVISLGSPAGLDFSVNEGIISAERAINGIDYFQTDVALNPGNSGGPLVDASGKIVGINNFKLKSYEGLNFAITSNRAKQSADAILE